LAEAIAHPDQMAFQPLFNPGKAPFNPGWFEKPPFHTYFNYFLSVWPIESLGLTPATTDVWKTVWSKHLQVLMFAACIFSMHYILVRIVRAAAALAVTALFASSAGYVAHTHFLTADIPVTFWMLQAFLMCCRLFESGSWRDYAIAGLLTGIAAATKYNGIAVGIAIPLAHSARLLIKDGDQQFFNYLLSPKLLVALSLVVFGFVLANPYALLDFTTFYSDFSYNSAVAPVYEGQTGHSYALFFIALSESVGLPVLILALVGAVYAIFRSVYKDPAANQRAATWAAASVLMVYYAKFAPFPRLENRFILPVAPYLLILAAPAVDRLFGCCHRVATVLFGSLAAYNVACSIVVGERFTTDPRLKARTAIKRIIPPTACIETDIYSSRIADRLKCENTLPFLTGRERLFATIFAGDKALTGGPEFLLAANRMTVAFSTRALRERNPDYILLSSNYYGRFTNPGPRRELYPGVARYFDRLLAGELGYIIVLDERSPTPPKWAYPKRIDFLDSRLVVLRRTEKELSEGARSQMRGGCGSLTASQEGAQ
jgi:hypothetical protein